MHEDQEDIAVSPQQSNKDAVLEVIPSTSTEVDVRQKQKHHNNYIFANKEEFASRALILLTFYVRRTQRDLGSPVPLFCAILDLRFSFLFSFS